MTRVIDLQPGDEVHLAGDSAVFIARTNHPLYPSLELVIWRMPDGGWSHDALDARQVVGDVVPTSHADRMQRLRTALIAAPLPTTNRRHP